MNIYYLYPWFKLDKLNSFVVLAILLFLVLTIVYSLRFIKGKQQILQYYTFIILTAIASIGAVLSNNLILLIVFWGFLGLTLYLLINMGRVDSGPAAKKTFIIVGGSDVLMLMGIGIIYFKTHTFQMDSIEFPVAINSVLPFIAYLFIAIACFAKVGAMPFHSWIPDCAETAPVPVVAYLPASLDKLLGIYLLARISLDLFVMNQGMNILLMLIGAFTIFAAVMMTLVQSDIQKSLAYLTIASAGYMILGLGVANPLGIAGGLFYMLNSAICNSCLFMCNGSVISRANTAELDKLGGLAKAMPLTYISALIASLSISGVPPFNGFFSKWMIYQGLVENFSSSRFLAIVSIVCLTMAMFGSGLTLASFMKLIHATFLGQPTNRPTDKQVKEVSWQMWFPCIVLAAICVVFGIFANQIPLKYFILPAVNGVSYIGTWYAGIATSLIIIGLILGLLLFRLKPLKSSVRQDSAFVGGEELAFEETKVTGTEFYNTIKEFGLLKSIYAKAEKGFFDIYDQGKSLVFGIGRFLQYLHNGVLPTYLVWTLIGMIVLFLVLVK